MKKLNSLLIILLFFSSLLVVSNNVIAYSGRLGQTSNFSQEYNISWARGSTNHYISCAELVTGAYNSVITSVWARIKVTSGSRFFQAGIYTSTGTLINVSNQLTITTTSYAWKQFNFTYDVPYCKSGTNYYIVVKGQSNGVGTNWYCRIQTKNSSGSGCYYQDSTTNTLASSISFSSYANHNFDIYAEYSCIPENSTSITTYENPSNTKGTHEYSYNSLTGYKVWANYTTTMKLRENLNSYLQGTHQSRWNSSTGNMMVWSNYSGAGVNFLSYAPQIVNYSVGRVYQGGITNKWVVYFTGSPNIKLVNNIKNATGTHVNNTFVVSKFSFDSDGFGDCFGNNTVWANYTGNLTQIHKYENIGYSIGTHILKQNNSGYWIWANYTSALTKSENIVNATGTHESVYDSVGNTWRIWANYTGIKTPIHVYQNIVNATGTHSYKSNNSGYWIWANYTGNGSVIPSPLQLYLYQNFVNSTGTHEYRLNSTGYLVWANVTGNNSNVSVGFTEEDIAYSSMVTSLLLFSGFMIFTLRRKKK
jgi:hypothetical protein